MQFVRREVNGGVARSGWMSGKATSKRGEEQAKARDQLRALDTLILFLLIEK